MKKGLTALILGCSLLSGTAGQAQTLPPLQPPAMPPSLGEPADIGAVFHLGETGFQPLEAVWAAHEQRSGLFAPVQSVLVLPGGRSPVRYGFKQPLEFVVRLLFPVNDPNGYAGQDPQGFNLLKLRAEDSERLLIIDEVGTFTNKGPEGVHVRVQPFGPYSFKLIPSQPLAPGEYLFKYGTGLHNQNCYAFGIDAPDTK